ncbi:MAG: hypothetical protein K9M82_10370 [Deltaproteobacteria bacterium]|nr:hypothetical protein [Deltaproteobacteria bacterium]
MTDSKKEKKTKETKIKKTEEDPLPVCTTAADAEHLRGEDEDEPCDDARAVEFETEAEEKNEE